MQLNLYNTKTKRVEKFKPQKPPLVGLYSCGPTVYDYAHLGNMRAYVFTDILRRVLEFNDYQVKHVMNITDVGHMLSDEDSGQDKIILSAERERKSPAAIADYYTQAFFNDVQQLNIIKPHIICKATDHIPEMIDFVKVLLEKGYAYQISDGIYFDIAKFPEYGKLSGINLQEQLEGARVAVNPEKKHPADFALWKKAPLNHIMQWSSPWGQGYPGWHIECSAMGLKYLNDYFDIHTGGVDHIPIHHENEIAQNWGFCGCSVVKYWIHNEFLQVDGGKMSKSLHNTYTINDLVQRGYSPLAFRYFLLTAHYRKLTNFTFEALEGAAKALKRLYHNVLRFKEAPLKDQEGEKALNYRRKFKAAVNDDLNIPQGLAILWDLVRKEEADYSLYQLIVEMEKVLGLKLDEIALDETTKPLDNELEQLIAQREQARRNKDFKLADQIRDELLKKKIKVIDTPEGSKWERIK